MNYKYYSRFHAQGIILRTNKVSYYRIDFEKETVECYDEDRGIWCESIFSYREIFTLRIQPVKEEEVNTALMLMELDR